MPETDRPSPSLLHEAGGVSLHLVPGEGAAGLIILAPDAAASAWAGRVATRTGRPALILVAGGEDGFSPAALAELAPHVASNAAESRIVIGPGTAAVTALRQAPAFGAAGAIGVAPRPDGSDDASPIGPGPAALLVFDPHLPAQAGLADDLAATGGVLPVPIHHAGDGLADALLGGGMLAEAIAALLAGDAPRAAMALRVGRLAARRMRAGLAARLAAAGHAQLAESVRALVGRPGSPELAIDARVRVLQRLGRHAEAAGMIGEWIKRQPRQALARRRLAACHLALGQPQRAVPALRAAIGFGSAPVHLHSRLVGALRHLRRADDAVQAAEAALAAAPGSAATAALLGETLLWAGRPEAAAAAFQSTLAKDPDHAGARVGMAVASDPGGPEDGPGPGLAALLATMAAAPAPAREWEALLDLVEAQDRPAVTIAVAAQAVVAAPRPGLLARAAGLQLAAGDAAAAEAAWRRLTEVAPDAPEGWLGLADTLARQKRASEAAAAMATAAAQHPAHPRIIKRAAELRLAAGDPVGAEQAARRALSLDPRDEEMHLLLADALWRQHRGRDALRAIEAGLATVPGSPAIGARKGHLLLMQGSAAPAAEAFRRVADQPHAPAHVWLGLTDALWRAGQVEAASAAAREGLAAFPRHVELRTRLGQLLLAGGDPEAARAALAEVVAEDPASEVVHLALADALWRQGRRAEALAAAREAAAAAPDQPAVAARLGHLLLENGDIAEAAAQFERATRDAPDLIPAWVGLCDAERLRKRIKPAIEAYRRAEALGVDRVTRRMLRFRLFGELEE
jgi:tetratricopeptide (TPR) repeat protein